MQTVCARELMNNVCAITPDNNSSESQTLESVQSVFTHSQTALTLKDFLESSEIKRSGRQE